MSKKIIYIITAVSAIIIIAFLSLLLKTDGVFETTGAMKAVPASSPLFIKINKPTTFFDNIPKNEMAKTLGQIGELTPLIEQLNHINTLINDNDDYKKLIKGNELIITLNYSGKDNFSPMLLIALKSKSESDLTNNILNKLKSESQATIDTRRYNKVIINEIKANNKTFYLAVNKGVLMISDKSMMVEDAIMQLEIESIENDPELTALLKTVGKQADLNLFINHKHAGRLLAKFTASSLNYKTSLISSYSRWTELDISISADKILLGGFSTVNTIENQYANTLLGQQPITSRIDRILPHSTAYFITLTLSSFKNYLIDYQEYLTKKNLFFQREDVLVNIEKETGIKVQELFIELLNQETAVAGLTADQANPKSGRTWIVDTKSGSTALTKMLDLQNRYIEMRNLNSAEWVQNYQIDSQTNFQIYRFPYPNLPGTLFGQLFSGVDASWFTAYGNYLIFGDSFRTVARALHSNVLGETLSASLDYNRFKSNLNVRSNITFFCNTAVALPIAEVLFNKTIAGQMKGNDELRKFKSVGWQVSSSSNMLYNNAYVAFNSELKSKPQTIWQSHMESAFDFKPKFVVNHNDLQNKEVVLQDKNHNFYLINNVGRVVWQIKLDGPILGEVHQIDYFRNGKLQYLFNTATRLYLIDRTGNNVNNFPVMFRTKVTNGVAIFDYENNKEYRFFVACSDGNLYAYNSDGNLLNGWEPFKTDHEVKLPLQHFRVDGKDFIVATDNMKDYVLHRRGTIRVKTDDIYPHSANNQIVLEERTSAHEPRLVITDHKGSIHYTYLDGRHVVFNHNIQLSEDHFFISADINNNGRYEYLFADGKQFTIIDADGKTLLKKQMDDQISHRPNVYSFSRNLKKIGITTQNSNKIHLFDINGASHPGFPLDGCTEFSIGFITNEMSNFNLLVGSPDGYLYNYYVE